MELGNDFIARVSENAQTVSLWLKNIMLFFKISLIVIRFKRFRRGICTGWVSSEDFARSTSLLFGRAKELSSGRQEAYLPRN